MATDDSLRSSGERIAALVAELAALADPVARAKAQELMQLVVGFYGAGLERMLELVDEEPQERAERLFGRFADDPLVASVLLLHGLHPVDVEVRIRGALERVRTHGVDATLFEVQSGVARIHVEQHANGRGPSSVAIRQAIEQAIEGVAPDVVEVDIQGLEEDPLPLIQLTANTRGKTARTLESARTA